MKAKLDIIGDPLLDFWNNGTNGEYRYGGALNVYNNAKNITINSNIDINSSFHLPTWETKDIKNHNYFNNYPLKYYLTDSDYNLVSSRSDRSHPLDCSKLKFNKEVLELSGYYFSGLIVSDYNKKFVENNLKHIKQNDSLYDFIVVDSRYANTDIITLRELTSCLILRRTDTVDRTISLANIFDYTIETCGLGPIEIKSSKLTEEISILPERYKALETYGAGDVFTSAVGCYLLYDLQQDPVLREEIIEGNIPYYNLINCIKFADKCAQQAVQEKYTCVTTISLG